jgi:hypothetical protein
LRLSLGASRFRCPSLTRRVATALTRRVEVNVKRLNVVETSGKVRLVLVVNATAEHSS